MKTHVWKLAIILGLPGCYTTLAPVNQGSDPAAPVQRIEVEHRVVDPWFPGVPWYGYGFYGGAYLYDPYYRYYYSDPWWYLPPAANDPAEDNPAIGSLGDSPAPPPGVRQRRTQDPNAAANKRGQKREKREKRGVEERRTTRGTLDSPTAPHPSNPNRGKASDDR
jgi:hypothetical protein